MTMVYSGPDLRRKASAKQERYTPPHKTVEQLHLTSQEMADQAGCSLRQLQWWDEQNIIHPAAVIGHRRVYNADQVPLVEALTQLRKMGVSLRKARRLLKRPGAELQELTRALGIVRRAGL